jgi:N-dimethylarginine dimethylaminohydrolase
MSLRHLKLIDVSEYVPKANTAQYKQDYINAGGRYTPAWMERYLDNWRGYNQDVCFDLNVLIIDRNNIIFGRPLPKLFQYLKTFGIESHVCEQRHMLYWEGGVHCSTLDVKRRGQRRSII